MMQTYASGFSQKSPFQNIPRAKFAAKHLKSTLTKGATKKKIAQQQKAEQIKRRKLQQNFLKQKLAQEEREKQSIEDKTNAIRPHQIYSNTFYYPNNKTKVFLSNLYFQMLLYFNFFFSFVFFVIFLSTSVVRMWMYSYNLNFLPLIITIFWLPFELFRIYYGYKGNIMSTFPELIAFLIFTGFSLAFVVVLWLQKFLFPIEVGVLIFESFFIISQLLIGVCLVKHFMTYSSSLFILRGQTMLDKDLQLYHSFQTLKTSRQIELGLKKSTDQTRRAEGIFKKQIDQILSKYGSSVNGDGFHTPYSRLQSARY